MNITRRYAFRPRLWPSMAVIVLLPLLLGLGFWQLDRAQQKAALQADFRARYNEPAVVLNELEPMAREGLHWRPVIASGSYSGEVYYLDNQVRRGEPGYRIYAPLKLEGRGLAVLVERDWLAMGGDRRRLPPVSLPAGEVRIEGRIVPPPATGIMLAEHRIRGFGGDRYRVQRIEPAELAGHSGLELLPYIVRHGSAAQSGEDRDRALGGFGRERHLGYAFQWFALAATLLIIYLVVNIRQRQSNNDH